jgi:glutaredoxin
MSNQIYIFTLDGCGHCVTLKNSLNNLQIPFIELEVGKNTEIWNEVVEQTGHNSLPTVFISLSGGEDGPVFIPGRDYMDKEEVIEKIKEYL